MTIDSNWAAHGAAWLLVAGLAGAGCSGSDDEGPGGTAGEDPFGNAAGTTGASGADGAGAGGGSGSDGATGAAASGGSTGPLSADTACGIGKVGAELTPVHMLVMFDRSRSMLDNDKWPNATAALSSFFENADAAGLRVALRFFPHDNPAAGCNDTDCDASACAQVLVPIGELSADAAPQDGHEAALVDAIIAAMPGDMGQGTPMYAALDGALQWTSMHQAANPAETTVLIFVTDGEPNGCNENFDDIAQLAADALAASGVATYAIGLEGSSEAQMDQLAAAGGTGTGIFIGNSANAEAELLTALDAIRGQTLSCNFAVPASTSAMPVDYAKVNVTVTTGAGVAGTLAQVADAAGCADSRAWHYDAPSAPSRIELCPAACDYVLADPASTIEVLLGCDTVCGGLDVDCGTGEPPPGVPPVL